MKLQVIQVLCTGKQNISHPNTGANTRGREAVVAIGRPQPKKTR